MPSINSSPSPSLLLSPLLSTMERETGRERERAVEGEQGAKMRNSKRDHPPPASEPIQAELSFPWTSLSPSPFKGTPTALTAAQQSFFI